MSIQTSRQGSSVLYSQPGPFFQCFPVSLATSMALRMLGRRSMSAAAAPVTKFGTPGRYANAIYAAAAQKNALAAVTDDLSLLKETLKASATLHHFVTNPSIPRETKASGIVKLLTSAKADVVTKNAMATLAEGGRMHDVLKVIDNYMEIITAAKGEVNAVITSAAPLPEEEKAAIRAQLVSFLVRCRPAPAYARDSPPPVSNRGQALLFLEGRSPRRVTCCSRCHRIRARPRWSRCSRWMRPSSRASPSRSATSSLMPRSRRSSRSCTACSRRASRRDAEGFVICCALLATSCGDGRRTGAFVTCLCDMCSVAEPPGCGDRDGSCCGPPRGPRTGRRADTRRRDAATRGSPPRGPRYAPAAET